ncbi:MFS transporter [Micromonospora sp. NPDC006766]|uniref:MFS transporter n=1 Tax=Micromonospora sp. NPDC006766 TaxID=3154778 RepID=UPI0033C3A19B
MSALGRVVQHVVSPDRLTRRLSLQSLLFSAGIGAFLTGSAVFFTQVIGLAPAEVGVGYSLVGFIVLMAATRLGRIADAIGPKRAWAAAAALEGLVYLCFPLARGFASFLALMVAIGLLSAAAGSARSGYTFGIVEASERVQMQAYLRTAFNVGLTLGSMLGSLALLSKSGALISAVPFATGILLLANGCFITRLPTAPSHDSRPSPFDQGGDEVAGPQQQRFGWRYRSLSVANGVLTSHQTILAVVLPLWLVTKTPAPRSLLGALFLINTFLAIVSQVRLSRDVVGVNGAVRANVRAAFLIAISCLLFLAAGWGNTWTAGAVLVAGCVAITIAEVLQSAASWGLVGELAPEGRRSEFQGLFQQGSSFESTVGPALFTYLALTGGAMGWLALAGLMLCAAWVVHRSVHGIETRRLVPARSGSDPLLHTASALNDAG